MATSTQSNVRAVRVLNILKSINESIGSSDALGLVGEDGTYAVPHPLRKAIARTALIMIQEAYDWKKGKSPEQIAAIEKKDKEGRAKFTAKKEKRRNKRREQTTKKGASRKRDGEEGDPRPPAPPAAGAQAVDGGEAPEDIYKSKKGKKLSLAPALTRMAKRRREGKVGSGKEAEVKGKGVQSNIDALHQTIDKLKSISDGARGHKTPPPGMPVGGRFPMRQPTHGEFPGQFRAAQRDKDADLAALEKDRQRRSPGIKGHRPPFMGPMRKGELAPRVGHTPAGLGAKAGKLARMRGRHALLRNRDHDTAKGYHNDPDSGDSVHSSGNKSNKKFANSTTFRDSDDDAMLHTDKSEKGSRASASDDEFVFKGDTGEDPRSKWYRVSKQGGYASAMASLGKSYHKDPGMRSKVIAKVKSTGFVDGSGHQINVKPTGAMHGERGACASRKSGRLTAAGKALKKRDPSEFYRLCKGPHGGSGTAAGRSEYERGFDPRHDDASTINRLHKAAESGKAEKPTGNIKAHEKVKPGRAADIGAKMQDISRRAGGTKAALSGRSKKALGAGPQAAARASWSTGRQGQWNIARAAKRAEKGR